MTAAYSPLISPSKAVRVASWALRLLSAAVFLAAGGAKIAGVPMMVAIFDQVGFGQWFRVLTGIVEVGGAIALLVTASTAFGALTLAVTMVFAVLTHLFLIGGNPLPAVVLLAMTGTVAWLHRRSFAVILDALR
ncbi:DoxX family protein [Rhizobium leguminosarum]